MKVARWFPTFWGPMNYTVHGILQARILEWIAFPSSKGSFQPRNQTQVSCIAGSLYQLSHKGSPRILEWVAYPFSKESSWPRNWTGVSCVADVSFTDVEECPKSSQATNIGCVLMTYCIIVDKPDIIPAFHGFYSRGGKTALKKLYILSKWLKCVKIHPHHCFGCFQQSMIW